MIPIEVIEPTHRVNCFSLKASNNGIRANLDIKDEVREESHIRVEALKRHVEMQHKSKVIPQQSVQSSTLPDE